MTNTQPLSQAEMAANAETWRHIDLVMRLLAGMQMELMKRQFTHDRSKLAPPEVSTYAEYTPKLSSSTYGSEEYKQFLKEMKPALDHHYAHNRHHPEFFENGVEDMNLIDLLEMVVDWYAATQKHNDGNIWKSIEINTERFGLSPQLVSVIRNTAAYLERMPIPFSHFETQKDINPTI